MAKPKEFEVGEFLPYLLNLAAEQTSVEFQAYYKRRYGMLRNEWRVLFHLGRYGAMTATEVGRRSRLHKTKISRAVVALEAKRLLTRAVLPSDRRQEQLSLTRKGLQTYHHLAASAADYESKLTGHLSKREVEVFKTVLRRLISTDIPI